MRLQHGFSLVEVLVSLVVISIGLLGVLAGQTFALRNVIDATQRTQAVALTAELLSYSHSNDAFVDTVPTKIEPGAIADSPIDCTAAKPCNSSELAYSQIQHWQNQLSNGQGAMLSKPEFCISGSAAAVEIKVSWQQRASLKKPVAADCAVSAGRSGFSLSSGGR